MGTSKKGISFYAKGFILIVIILAIWEVAVGFEYITRLVLPRPSLVAIVGLSLLTSSDFYLNILSTLVNWFVAFVIGATIGFLLGFVSAVNKNVEQTILPVSAFLRSIPPIALFPISLIILGIGRLPIIVVGIIYIAIYVYPIASQAADTAKQKFGELSIILNLSKIEFIKTIIIPATLISIIVSSRIAASFLFAIAIAGEILMGRNTGIGAAIVENSERYLLEEAYFYILITGILGLIIDLILARIQENYSYKG